MRDEGREILRRGEPNDKREVTSLLEKCLSVQQVFKCYEKLCPIWNYSILSAEHRVWSAAEDSVLPPLPLAGQRPPDRPNWDTPGPPGGGRLRGRLHVNVLHQ